MTLLILIAAACCFTSGLVLQARGARVRDGEPGLLIPLTTSMKIGWPWLLGTLLTFVGFGLELVALRTAPVAIVQPLLAAGIVLVPLWSWAVLRERPVPTQAAAVAVVVAGIIVMEQAAGSSNVGNLARIPQWRELATLVVSLGLLAFAAVRTRNTVTLTILAGAANGTTTLAAKLIATAATFSVTWCAGWIGVAIFGSVALVAETSVLRVRSPSAVAPLTLFVTTTLPIVLALIWFDEHWKNPASMLIGIALALGGIITLSRAHSQPDHISDAHEEHS